MGWICFPIAVRGFGADVVAFLARCKPSCFHSAADSFIFPSAHKQRKFKVFLVKLVIRIIVLNRSYYFGIWELCFFKILFLTWSWSIFSLSNSKNSLISGFLNTLNCSQSLIFNNFYTLSRSRCWFYIYRIASFWINLRSIYSLNWGERGLLFCFYFCKESICQREFLFFFLFIIVKKIICFLFS